MHFEDVNNSLNTLLTSLKDRLNGTAASECCEGGVAPLAGAIPLGAWAGADLSESKDHDGHSLGGGGTWYSALMLL